MLRAAVAPSPPPPRTTPIVVGTTLNIFCTHRTHLWQNDFIVFCHKGHKGGGENGSATLREGTKAETRPKAHMCHFKIPPGETLLKSSA
jgi:hypothetical protein